MSYWVKLHATEIVRLKKFNDLRVSLGWSVGECLGYLGLFWGHTLEVQENGDVTGWDSAYVAALLGFGAQVSEKFWSGLGSHGWIDQVNDRLLIHDWLDSAGAFLVKKYSSSNKEKLIEIWALHGRVYGSDLKATSKRPQSDPKATIDKIRLDIKEKYKKEKNRAGPGTFIPPTPEEVDKYAQELGQKIDGKHFCDYHQSKGWIVGKSPMKDWKAAVRLWINNASKYSAKQPLSQAQVDDLRKTNWVKAGLCGMCGGKWETIDGITRCGSCCATPIKIQIKKI